MSSSVLVLDAGNSIIKFARKDGTEGEFPHALKEISEAEISNILKRNSGSYPEGYVRINGTPYAYGTHAERYGVLELRKRAARYTKDYYGVLAAIAISESYARGSEFSVFGSHAPGDVDYRDNLMDAAAGFWEVEIGNRTMSFNVVYANTFDEPQGGLMNIILADDGKHYKNSAINGGRALVIDIGGRTTDLLAVNPGGEIDYALQDSAEVGILNVIEAFSAEFRRNNKSLLQALSELPAERVRDAIRTNEIKIGGRTLDCSNEVNAAVNIVLNRFNNIYQTRAGGGADFDTIALTGGGSGLLSERLEPILNHPHVILADTPAKIHLANVRGGLKLWRFYEAEGLITQ